MYYMYIAHEYNCFKFIGIRGMAFWHRSMLVSNDAKLNSIPGYCYDVNDDDGVCGDGVGDDDDDDDDGRDRVDSIVVLIVQQLVIEPYSLAPAVVNFELWTAIEVEQRNTLHWSCSQLVNK